MNSENLGKIDFFSPPKPRETASEGQICGGNSNSWQSNQHSFSPIKWCFGVFWTAKTLISDENGRISVFIVISKNFGKIDIFGLSDPLKAPLKAHLGHIPVLLKIWKIDLKIGFFRCKSSYMAYLMSFPHIFRFRLTKNWYRKKYVGKARSIWWQHR